MVSNGRRIPHALFVGRQMKYVALTRETQQHKGGRCRDARAGEASQVVRKVLYESIAESKGLSGRSMKARPAARK
jgi:hypothetical protein